jgi:hypothetical protein
VAIRTTDNSQQQKTRLERVFYWRCASYLLHGANNLLQINRWLNVFLKLLLGRRSGLFKPGVNSLRSPSGQPGAVTGLRCALMASHFWQSPAAITAAKA